jgi:DNA-binding response OmpR family regulator
MSPTILVIDDDEAVRYAIRRVARDEGFTVALAANGDGGLALLESVSPALVITDLIMPEKEGLGTIRELRKRRPDLPVIAISGGGRLVGRDFLDLARKLGAQETLAKPFEPEQLVDAMRRQLRAVTPIEQSPSAAIPLDRTIG